MQQMLEGTMPHEEVARILREMAARGETVDEIVGMAMIMRTFVNRVHGHEDAVDTCGTGGSGLERINTSTMVAFVLAAGDVKIAKHGNRAAGGRCGSFDVLEAVGAKIELSPEQVEKTLNAVGLGFMFAPLYHPAMKHVMPVRKELGIRTIFNLLGPLTNPAFVRRQIMGVSDLEIAEKMVAVMQHLGHERALVVHGEDGLDEITITGRTTIFDLKGGDIEHYEFDPTELGLELAPFEEITGGTIEQNAEIFIGILSGVIYGPKRNLVLVNAAAGFVLADRSETMEGGLELAMEVLDSGAAQEKFEEYVRLTKVL